MWKTDISGESLFIRGQPLFRGRLKTTTTTLHYVEVIYSRRMKQLLTAKPLYTVYKTAKRLKIVG